MRNRRTPAWIRHASRRSGASGLLALGLSLSMLPAAGLGQGPAHAGDAPPAFNQADYELAWLAFLGAGRLDDAIALAHRALRLQPGSVLWHQRLASAAEQSGDAALAADAYAWLATVGAQDDQLQHAIDLSSATGQNDTAIRLMLARAAREPFNQDHWNQLIASMLDVGRFDQALEALGEADRRQPRRYFLLQQVAVLDVAGRADARADMLRRIIARYGADPRTSLQLAATEYVHGRLQPALDTLRAAQPAATAADTLYWQTLGSLAWMLQDFATAGTASRTLIRAGTAQAADYSHLYRIHIEREPAVAYAYALTGWRQTHAVALFFQAAAAAGALQQPVLLGEVFGSIRAGDRATLENESQYWVQWAQLAHAEGNDGLALARYGQALRRAPHDAGVAAGLLWLFVDSHDQHLLHSLVERFGATTPADAGMREAMTAAFAMLDQPGRALALMQPGRNAHHDDPEWLSQYADLLDQADQAELAQAMRRAALAPLRRATAAAEPAARARLRLKMIALTSHLAPGDPTLRAIAPLACHPDDAAVREQVLAWTISLDSPEATALWMSRHYRHGDAPSWAQLSQSLATDDDTTTMQLLRERADQLPRRDRVTAAQKLGWNAEATTLAYQGLVDEPDDRQLAIQFQNLAIDQAGRIGTTLSGLHSGGLQAVDNGLDARLWPSHAWTLDLAAHRVRQTAYDTTQLTGIPATADYASVTLTEHLSRSERGVSLGGGRNLAGYTQWGAFYRYRVWQSLQLGAAVDYGARIDDTVPLSLGGLSDRVKASVDYQWTPWDSLSATAAAGRLRAQAGGALGQRQSIDLEYRHKLWLAPPDFSLIATATDARYQPAANLPDALHRLLPADRLPDIGFVVPRSYTQICAGAAFNENFRSDWSDRWRWFGNASACRNSVSGNGASFNAGLATPWLGPDHFSLALGYATNTGPSGSTSLNLSLNYRYYFTP